MANKKNQRVNFASVKSPLAYPDFLEVQLKSFKDFLQLDTPPELRKYATTLIWSFSIISLTPLAILSRSVWSVTSPTACP